MGEFSTNYRANYQRFFYIIVAVAGTVLIMFVSLTQAAAPYLRAGTDRFSNSLNAVCDCARYIPFQEHPIAFMVLAISIGAFIASVALSFVRSGFAWLNTYRLQQRLRAASLHVTVMKGIRIHRVQSENAYAICVGLWRPQVYVSTQLEQLLTPTELWAVLRHELSHALYRDPFHRFVLGALFPFMPTNSKLFAHHRALQELAADEYVADDVNLSSALVKLLNTRVVPQAGVFAAFSSVIDVRMNRLLGHAQVLPGYVTILIIAFVIIGAMAYGYTTFAYDTDMDVVQNCLQVQPMCQEVMSYVQMSFTR